MRTSLAVFFRSKIGRWSDFRFEALIHYLKTARLFLGSTDATTPVSGPGLSPDVTSMSVYKVDIAPGCTSPLLYIRPSLFLSAVWVAFPTPRLLAYCQICTLKVDRCRISWSSSGTRVAFATGVEIAVVVSVVRDTGLTANVRPLAQGGVLRA